MRVARDGKRAAGLAAILALGMAFVFVGAQPAAGQVSTPSASPVAGGVPCTNLFGIALGNACVLVLNASPDAGPVDIYVDGELAITGATFGTLGDFIPVNAGARQLQIVPSGAVIEDAVVDTQVNLAEGVAYEVAAIGPLDDVIVQVHPVDTAPLPEGMARLRLIHASSDAPPVDLAVAEGYVLFENVAYPDISGYAEPPASTYDLEARIAGTTDLALPLPGTVLAPNVAQTVYLVGQVADASLGAVIVPVLISPDIAGAVATPVG